MPGALAAAPDVRCAGSVLSLLVVENALVASASAEPSSQPGWTPAARLDTGGNHSCGLLESGDARCWGFNGDGQLGYGNTTTIGDDETPGSVGPVSFGSGRTATAISAGDFHTCAVLDDGAVRCWALARTAVWGMATLPMSAIRPLQGP